MSKLEIEDIGGYTPGARIIIKKFIEVGKIKLSGTEEFGDEDMEERQGDMESFIALLGRPPEDVHKMGDVMTGEGYVDREDRVCLIRINSAKKGSDIERLERWEGNVDSKQEDPRFYITSAQIAMSTASKGEPDKIAWKRYDTKVGSDGKAYNVIPITRYFSFEKIRDDVLDAARDLDVKCADGEKYPNLASIGEDLIKQKSLLEEGRKAKLKVERGALNPVSVRKKGFKKGRK